MATVCTVQKIDSNLTGLRIAQEACLKVLPSLAAGDPADPVWRILEPNSYSDYGGNVVTVARNPINPSRQRKKGTVTDLDASGGYNADLTQDPNFTWLMQGICFADAREKPATQPINGTNVVITGVTTGPNTYTAATGLAGFKVNGIVLASGFGVAANNGVKVLSAVAAGVLTTLDATAAEAAPPAEAKVETVGYQFPVGDVSIAMNGNLVRLNSTAANLNTLGLIAGEWVYLGGDAAANYFANNRGLARIGTIAAGYIEFDKVGWVPQVEAGAGKTIRMFMGTVVKNESDPALIKRRSYQLERTLGQDSVGTMSEYLVGAVPNEFTLNVQQADKVTTDVTFVACDAEQRTGTQGLKTGTRPAAVSLDGYNTSSDFSRIKLSIVDPASSNPVALFAFVTELTLTINNNVSPNKAVGVLGAFELSAGTFEVGGSQTAYFANVDAVQAVRNNSDVTVDIFMVKKNAGMLFDVPLASLGNGRLNVEQDQPITLPLDTNAAESKFGNTLTYQAFAYLPNAADIA